MDMKPAMTTPAKPAAAPAPEATDASVRVQVDETKMQSLYANAFRCSQTPEEIMLDLGLNMVVADGPTTGEGPRGGSARFEIGSRVIMNYYTAKRLAMLLGNVVRQHEQRFGELKMSIAERSKPAA